MNEFTMLSVFTMRASRLYENTELRTEHYAVNTFQTMHSLFLLPLHIFDFHNFICVSRSQQQKENRGIRKERTKDSNKT